jgi:hypothetical protein
MRLGTPTHSRNIIFYKLNDAVASLIENERVWARDRQRNDGKWGKKFLIMSPFRFIQKIKDETDPEPRNWYEIISEKQRCRFHLDIELGQLKDGSSLVECQLKRRLEYLGMAADDCDSIVETYITTTSRPFNNRECKYLFIFLQENVNKFLALQFPSEYDEERTIYLNGCRVDKFSLHVVNRDIIFDRNYLSCRYFVWEFCRYLWNSINQGFLYFWEKRHDHPAKYRAMIRLLMLEKQYDKHGWRGVNDTPVDETIYTRNRQFRMVGMTKTGSYPLRLIRNGPEPPETLISDNSSSSDVLRNIDSITSTLVVPRDVSESCIIMLPSVSCPFFQQYARLFLSVHNCSIISPTIEWHEINSPYEENRSGLRMKKFEQSRVSVRRACTQRYVFHFSVNHFTS